MSTDATPAPTPPTPPAPPPGPPEPVVELVRTQRANVGYALTALAAAFLVVGVMMVVQSNKASALAATTDQTKDGKDLEDLTKGLSKDATADLGQSNRFDYLVGAFGCALGLVVTGAGAAYLIVSLPKPTEAGQRREARVFLLAVGGLLGLSLIFMGAWFFIRWSDSLVKWLDKGEMKEAKYALYPILMVVVGGLLMLSATQPARAEERNNTTVRRLVYGSNFALAVLTLFVVLVIANAVVAMRLPNKLDTTQDGFYSLNDQTRQFLERMEQPIRAVAIFQDGGPVTADTKRLLEGARDANPSKFQVRFISPARDRDELAKLRAEYPMAEMSSEGVLLISGEGSAADRKRHTFIRADEFASDKEGPGGQRVETFSGEPKLLRELMFLAEDKKKPKVYFTQSSGELSLSPGGEPKRSAAQLKAYLEKNYFDVAPLAFELATTAKVPDDATVVIVADPTAPLPAAGAEALRKFMTEPRPDGSKGKLVLLAGAQPGADRKPLKLGLDPVLAPFGVTLSDRFMYSVPSNQLPNPREVVTGVTREAVAANNPVALGFANEQLLLRDCREVSKGPGGAFQAVNLLVSLPGQTLWLQEEYAANPLQALKVIEDRSMAIRATKPADRAPLIEAFQRDFQVTESSRPLAVLVSEKDKDRETARVAVFGCGWFVSDEASGRTGRGQTTTLWLDLMGSTLDWVRDRPTVQGLTDKEYTQYTLKPGYDTPRLVYVPLGIGLLTVLGLGAGVWVVRRK